MLLPVLARHARAVAASAGFARIEALVVAALIAACGGSSDGGTAPVSPATGAPRTLVLTMALPALDSAREGRYAAWVVSEGGTRSPLGRFGRGGTFTFTNPVADAASVEVTVQRPSDQGSTPSAQVILQGRLTTGHAALSYIGAVTQGDLPLRLAPGQFTMFTPSDNDSLGYPSHEEAGVWLFNMSPAATAQRDYYVRLTQLQPGWTYEGWMVRDLGTPAEIWLSYGKFIPDWTGAVNQPDDTGWGPFSGVKDYQRARLEDFPGDDWISNPLGLPWRSELPLPLDLREKDAAGRVRWSHVITIEPATDRGEPVTTERPFVMRPYVDGFGDAGPGVARTITAFPERMPSGSADAR